MRSTIMICGALLAAGARSRRSPARSPAASSCRRREPGPGPAARAMPR